MENDVQRLHVEDVWNDCNMIFYSVVFRNPVFGPCLGEMSFETDLNLRILETSGSSLLLTLHIHYIL